MKLKAFSFLEVMVAIVVSGIVISTVYSVYIFTYKQFLKYTTIKAEIRTYFEFSQVFNNDFEKAKTVIKKDKHTFELSHLNKSIFYEFDEEYISRTNEYKTDTFFLQNEIIEISVLNNLSKIYLIDYLKITVDDKTLSFYKNYGPTYKIE